MTTETRAKKIDLKDDAAYAEAWNKQQSLQLELLALEGDVDAVNQALSLEGQSPLEEAADRILAGVAVEVEVDPDAAHHKRLVSMSDLQWRRRVLSLAISKQRATVDAAAGRASASICEALRPEYQDVIANLATALLTLADASEREREFREQLIDGDRHALVIVARNDLLIVDVGSFDQPRQQLCVTYLKQHLTLAEYGLCQALGIFQQLA